jgi:hypothetical protein
MILMSSNNCKPATIPATHSIVKILLKDSWDHPSLDKSLLYYADHSPAAPYLELSVETSKKHSRSTTYEPLERVAIMQLQNPTQ